MAAWRYSINYGPEGEANYAMVYDDAGMLVGNLKTYHAIAFVSAMNAAPQPASDVPHDVVRALEEALELLQEKRHGNPARSPGHNAQNAIKRALAGIATPAPSTSTEEALRKAVRSFERADQEFSRASNSGEQPRLSNAGTAYQVAKWKLFEAAKATSTAAKCFECDGPLHGPYCPTCRPTEEALRAENARLREILGNANNLWRHEFSKEVEDAADKLFKRLSWNSPTGALSALSR